MTKNEQKKDKAVGEIRAANRQLIIDSATRLFAQLGFGGTTIQKIADECQLPKANILYYFGSKMDLYKTVLKEILGRWNSSFDNAVEEDDPAEKLAQYIEEKMQWSKQRPMGSKVFALEIINGAQVLNDYLDSDLNEWFESRVAVIDSWVQAGKISPTEPRYLIFQIWACTQHYADFSSQITGLAGEPMSDQDYKNATQYLIKSILGGLGLTPPKRWQ